MALHPLAGTPAPASALIDVERLEHEFMTRVPDLADPRQRVKFGTSGHRGTSLDGSLTAAHIAAITQAICDYRRGQEIDGLLYMGMDTHALSEPSQEVALQVLAANGVETVIQRDGGFTPTPVVSRAIIVRNRGRKTNHADGIVDHAVAQSSRGRRVQVQPSEWRARGHRRHAVDSKPRQRIARQQGTRDQANVAGHGDKGAEDASQRIS